MAWKSWDVYVVKDGETVHRGVTGGVSRQSARELASTLFNIAKDKLMLVPKGSAGRKKRAATPMGTQKIPSSKISTKDPAAMTAAEINKELDKLNEQDSTLDSLMIEAGRGHERPSEYLRMTDPLSTELRKNSDRRQDLRIEIEMRYGPGAPSRLPTSKRGWYGPRLKTQSPTHGGMGFGKRYGGD